MAQKDYFSAFLGNDDFSKFFEAYQTLPVDIQGLLETQRKNLQSLSEAQQLLMNNIQAIAQRQSEIISQTMQEQSSITQALMREGTPEEKISQNAELLQKSYKKIMANATEISEMVKKSNDETSKLLNKRMTASMDEIKTALEDTQKKAA